MHIVIAGGHGKIALILERLLAQRGDSVAGLIRNPAQAADLEAAGAEAVVVDLEKASVEEVAEHVRGADAVVFAAGAGPGSGAARKETVDRDAAILLADAAEAAGVDRYVMVSAMAADPRQPPRMRCSRHTCGRKALRTRRSGPAPHLNWTIVRPGMLTDDPGTGRVTIADSTGRGSIPREDVAAVLVAVLDEPRTAGQTFELISGETPIDEAIAALCADRNTAGMPTTPQFETLLYKTEPPVATITLNRPERAEHHRAADARRDRGGDRDGRARPCGQGDRAARRGPRVLRRLRLRRRLPALGRHDDDRRSMGPRQGFRAGQRSRDRAHTEVHGDLAGVETRHRSGARLVRRRRKRLRAVRRHRHRQRRRRDRHTVRPDVGRLPHRHVALPAEPCQGEVALIDRRAADRKGSRSSRTDQRIGARSKTSRPASPKSPRSSPNSAVPVAGAEAHRQPGIREHGPGVDADARRDPRRVDAQHAGRAEFIDTAANQGVRAAIERRDGPWGDYSQAPPERRPDPSHVIEP